MTRARASRSRSGSGSRSRSRYRIFRALVAVLALLVCDARAPGQSFLIEAERVYPVDGPPIDGGKVLVRDGRIVAVGQEIDRAHLTEGEPAQEIRIAGSLVPGFVDAASEIGIRGRAADEFRELSPSLRAIDGVDSGDRAFARALRGGVTTVGISPLDRNVIGGLGAVVRTRDGSVLAEDAFLEAALTPATYSGNRTLRSSSPSTYEYRIPTTRMGSVFVLRRALIEALDPGRTPDAAAAGAARDPSDPFVADAEFADVGALGDMLGEEDEEIIRRAVRGEMPLRIWADYYQEVAATFHLMEEFDAKVQILGGSEIVGMVGRIAAAGIPVILIPGPNVRDADLEAHPRYSARVPARLAEAGVRLAFASRDANVVQRLRERVALSLRFGLSADDALEALTLGGAEVLGVADRIGSISPGKDADLVALSGEPLGLTSGVLWVMAGGEIFPGSPESEQSAQD